MIFGFLTKFRILVYFFRIKNKKIRNRKKSWKSIENIFSRFFIDFFRFFMTFRFFTKILYWLFNEIFWFPKKSRKIFFRYFFKIFFDFENFYFLFKKNILKSKIWSGTQKSYLENYTSILKLFKIKNPIFLTQISGFPYSVTYTDP